MDDGKPAKSYLTIAVGEQSNMSMRFPRSCTKGLLCTSTSFQPDLSCLVVALEGRMHINSSACLNIRDSLGKGKASLAVQSNGSERKVGKAAGHARTVSPRMLLFLRNSIWHSLLSISRFPISLLNRPGGSWGNTDEPASQPHS